LNDFELGWRYVSPDVQLSTNAYFMNYKNQLVLTGALNDVGAPLRENIGDSYRLGLEIDANIRLGDKFQWSPNLALSSNKNRDFVFERDGVLQELGNTNIAFSPNVIAGNRLAYVPSENLQIAALTKYVGKQYMGNIDSEGSILEAYSQTDLNVQYVIEFDSVIKSLTLSGLLNNVFNSLYESNGYFFTFDDDFTTPGVITTIEGAGYYPQAGTNFLLGATIRF
jgi:iron complex outermembrane receptor protein